MKKYGRFFRYQFPAIFWMTAIFVQSSISRLSVPDMGFKMQDKVAHAIEYAILAALLLRAFKYLPCGNFSFRALSLTLIVGASYAMLDEIHQYFVPGRTADIFDVAADIAGVIIVIVVARVLGGNKRDRMA
ncbi:MAG: VanZ family protein [Calditrichaeota bacterium]|nr:VanZ family protein [Calditrichota bacterium]